MLVGRHLDGIRCHQILTTLTKEKTQRLFMFREFEKIAEKETPGVSFFVKLCLSSPKKYKTILERTARPMWSRSTFRK